MNIDDLTLKQIKEIQALPYIVLHLVVGVFLAVLVDGYIAVKEIAGE